jgi:hypothetical protein
MHSGLLVLQLSPTGQNTKTTAYRANARVNATDFVQLQRKAPPAKPLEQMQYGD